MSALSVKDWSDYQHYKERSPAWIKLHKKLLDNFEFHRLPDASKALAMFLWLLASETKDGQIDFDAERIAFRLRMSEEKFLTSLKPLIDADFIRFNGDASELLAERKQDAIPEREEETEEEKETDSSVVTREAVQTVQNVSRETSALENAEAVAILKAFDAERVLAFGESRARPWPHPMDLTEAQRWITAGATEPLCRPIFAAAMSRMAFAGKPPPDTLSYFERPVSEAIARANQPLKVPTDDELANTLPTFLDARKKRPSGFDSAVAAARSLVVGE